jgi:hypothetical protein
MDACCRCECRQHPWGLSLFLTIAVGGLCQMMLRDRQADTTRRALRIAQSRLDELGTIRSLAAGSSQGVTAERFAWHETIRPALSTPLMRGYWVEVRVSVPDGERREGRSVTLTTFKIAPVRR